MSETIQAVHLGVGSPATEPAGLRIARESDLLSVDHQPDLAGGLATIEAGEVGCVLADESLARADDCALLDRLQTIDSAVPVVVITSDHEPPQDLLEAGATDFVVLADDETPASHQTARVENAALRYRSRGGDEDGDPARPDVAAEKPVPAQAPGNVEHEEYERLIGKLGQSIFVADEDGEYTYVNPSGAEITGYEPAAIVEGGPELLFPDDERETFATATRSLLADDGPDTTTVEATLETKAGKSIPIEVTMTLRTDGNGGFGGVVGVVRDVTEQRETERRLRENRTIMRAIPDEIVVLDTEGFLTRVIPSVDAETTASGYTPEEIAGMHVSKVMDDDSVEEAANLLEEMITGDRERATQEVQIVTRDGERLWYESHFTLLEDEDGTILGSIGILRDIEERLAYETELERQNERLEQFASITSHDLRNPLNLAQGYIELVEKDCDTEHTDAVGDALDRMDRLIGDTLTWARQGAEVDERQPVALARLVAECWEAAGSAAGTVDVADDLTVSGDPDRLRRLFENLLRNAVEHGGEDVSVRVGAIERDGALAGFYIADDGPGIPPGERESVFEAGYTTASDGTGFGLAIIAEICEAHGWEIGVTDSESGGARFEITGVARPG